MGRYQALLPLSETGYEANAQATDLQPDEFLQLWILSKSLFLSYTRTHSINHTP